jgi:PPK2 family polyphosphate:nucleotide phosphotransferase
MKHRIKPGKSVHLDQIDPDDTSLMPAGKHEGREELEKLQKRLGELQEVLFAEHKHRVLIVLQGMDTSGKDGTVRSVLDAVNPQGVRVESFKRPTEEELEHDYLWRAHKRVPANGEIVVFNRSYYEDVLVVRVHSLVPEEVWRPRFDQINDFERMLTESGTLILKFFLHIDKAEQKKRLQSRIDDPTKRWKFQHGDIEERRLWDSYTRSYEDVLEKTSTDAAPWYVVPSNTKWYRNYVIADAVVGQLEKLKMAFPEPDLSKEVID